MEQYILYIWGAVALIMIVLEVACTGILQIWFAIGAVCAAVVAWFQPANYLLQLLVFFSVSGILLLIGTKLLSNKAKKPNKNPVFSILDKEAIVTKEINNQDGVGQVSVNGEMWSAKSKEDEIIPENTKVKVLEIDGVKAVVEVIK
ncbi:MAG: NfeD family protein [Clostridia bacterium]|nr:NfeD family protein [Clostridia bacterium]